MRMQSKPGESPSARGDLKQNMAVAVDSGVIALEILFRYFHHGDSVFINKASEENDYALSFNSRNLVRRSFPSRSLWEGATKREALGANLQRLLGLSPFSSPEAALLLVSTKNRDFWC